MGRAVGILGYVQESEVKGNLPSLSEEYTEVGIPQVVWLGDLSVALDESATVYEDQDWLRALCGDCLGVWIVYVQLYRWRSLLDSNIARKLR